MEEWFYVKNDLKAREDIKEIIMRPIWSRFGLRKPKVEIDEAVEACRRAFSTVFSFIGTRDLLQEHIAYKIWPLLDSWEMPKENITNPSEGGLVRLKYTFRFGDKFVKPDDDWLKCIENTSDELLGAYSKSEDNALSAAFGSRKKKRLNRFFDAIGFVYPDYYYPLWGRGKKRKTAASTKAATSAKTAALATLYKPSPKSKKLKVLTHRPRYIEPTVVPDFGGETSSAAAPKEPTPTQKAEEPATIPKAPSVEITEPKADRDKAEEPKTEEAKRLGILSPSAEISVPMAQKGLAATPKRKRMVNELDVLETVKTLSSTPSGKIPEASKMQTEAETEPAEIEAAVGQVSAEARPSEPAEKKSSEIEEKVAEEEAIEQTLPEKVAAHVTEALKESIEYIIRHALGKRLSSEEEREAQHYAQKLKYPKGALVFNGSGEEDFLYCLSDSKEISICREMSRSFGFPTLEDGLSVLSKDELADSLAYNSIKVRKLIFVFKNELFHLFALNSKLLLQGLILSNALRAQKNIEDEGCTMALNNLHSEVIELRNEGLEKDKILISLVNKIKEDEGSSKVQAEAQKSEIEDLRKQLAEAKLKCAVAETDRNASEYWKKYFEETVAELRASKERCFEKSVECIKKIKTSFANVGAYSSEDNFIRGDPEGVIE
jgi:hypothetical protein